MSKFSREVVEARIEKLNQLIADLDAGEERDILTEERDSLILLLKVFL